MLQRFNSVLLHDTLPVDLPDLWPSDILILAFVVFNPGDLYYLGYKFKKNNNNNITYSFIANCQTAVVHKNKTSAALKYKSQYILRYNILTVELQSVIREMQSGSYIL